MRNVCIGHEVVAVCDNGAATYAPVDRNELPQHVSITEACRPVLTCSFHDRNVLINRQQVILRRGPNDSLRSNEIVIPDHNGTNDRCVRADVVAVANDNFAR